MKPPPLSGPALRAVVAAAESHLTGDVIMQVLRNDSGIAALNRVPVDPSDDFPADQRPLVSPQTEAAS